VLPSLTTCLSVNIISDVIRGCAQFFVRFVVTEWMKKSLDSFSRQLCWLRFYMQSQLGGGLPHLLIGNELRHLSVAVCGLVSTGQANQPWRSLLLTVTTTSSEKCYTIYSEHHVLKQLLPDVTNHQYHLRQRPHNHCLTVKTDDRNFVTRLLFKDLFWHYVYITTLVAFCQLFLQF